MKPSLNLMWIAIAILLMLNALNALTFNLILPSLNPSLNTFMNRIANAFISLAFAAGIITYLKHEYKND